MKMLSLLQWPVKSHSCKGFAGGWDQKLPFSSLSLCIPYLAPLISHSTHICSEISTVCGRRTSASRSSSLGVQSVVPPLALLGPISSRKGGISCRFWISDYTQRLRVLFIFALLEFYFLLLSKPTQRRDLTQQLKAQAVLPLVAQEFMW